MSIEQQIGELQHHDTIRLLGKKNEALTRIKRNFFDRFLKFSTDVHHQDINKARTYQDAFVRATRLSLQVYARMQQTLHQEVRYTHPQLEHPEAFQNLSSWSAFLDHDTRLIHRLKSYADAVETARQALLHGDTGIPAIAAIAERQEALLERFLQVRLPFLEDMELLEDIDRFITQEEAKTTSMQHLIATLNHDTQTFAQRVQEDIQTTERSLIAVFREIKAHPIRSIFKPAELLGRFLEKHASIFAASILSMTIAEGIAELAGLAGAAIAVERVLVLTAEFGEGAQAIPAVEEGAGKLRNYLKHTVARCRGILHTARA